MNQKENKECLGVIQLLFLFCPRLLVGSPFLNGFSQPVKDERGKGRKTRGKGSLDEDQPKSGRSGELVCGRVASPAHVVTFEFI